MVGYMQETVYIISLAIKKSLSDNGQETTLKIKYTGEENILEIKSKLEDTIKQNKDTENSNNTDNLAGILSKTPNNNRKICCKSF